MFIAELEVQLFPMLSTFLLSMFFLGMLGLVDIVTDPFGADVDDFSPDSLLFSAERSLFSFLASPGTFDLCVIGFSVSVHGCIWVMSLQTLDCNPNAAIDKTASSNCFS